MPVYEFKCRECGHPFSEIRKTGDFKASCPKCNSENVEKMISVFSSHSSAGKCSHTGGG